MTDTTYSHVILFDVDPSPNQPHVYCETIPRSGVTSVLSSRLKLTENLRQKPIELPIYETPHCYYVVAKVDADCSMLERNRATNAVYEHVLEALQQDMAMAEIARSIVKEFPGRVIKGKNYAEHNAPSNRLGTSSRFKPKNFSSSDTDTGKKQAFKQPRKVKKAVAKKKSDEDAALKAAADVDVAAAAGVVVTHVNNPLEDIPDLEDLLSKGDVHVSFASEGATAQADAASARSVEPAADREDPPPVILNHQSSASTSNGQSPADALGLTTKLDYMQKQLGEKLSKLHGAISYLSGKIDDIDSKQGELKELINSYMANTMAEDFMEKPDFPFTEEAQLYSYLEDDPKGKHLIER